VSGFRELASYLFWKQQELVVALIGYFDESGHPPDPVVHSFVIAGLVAERDDWLTFDHQWLAVLASEGLSSFHLKELKNPNGGWSGDRLAALIAKLEDVIAVTPVKCLISASTVYQKGASRSAIRAEYLERHRYLVLNTLQQLFEQRDLPEKQKVNFVFARHPEVNPISHFEYLRDEVADARSFYHQYTDHIGDIALASPDEQTPLQAADLVAGQIYAYNRDHAQCQPRLIREFMDRTRLITHPFRQS